MSNENLIGTPERYLVVPKNKDIDDDALRFYSRFPLLPKKGRLSEAMGRKR